MGDEPWRPYSLRSADQEAGGVFDGPHDGVPSWLSTSLAEWRNAFFFPGGKRDDAVVHRVVRRLRMDPAPSFWELIERCKKESSILLDVVDVLVSDARVEAAAELELILREAGSALTVAGTEATGFQLQRRLDPTVKAAAEQAGAGERAGEHLARAWSAAYGRHGNPGHAYGEAVKAVEATACPVVSPKNTRCTLGTIIRDLKNGAVKFEVGLDSGSVPFDQVAAVIGMLELLWRGQNRHGSDDDTVPIDASPEEAAAAVHLAVVLVHWFRSGVVRRKAA